MGVEFCRKTGGGFTSGKALFSIFLNSCPVAGGLIRPGKDQLVNFPEFATKFEPEQAARPELRFFFRPKIIKEINGIGTSIFNCGN